MNGKIVRLSRIGVGLLAVLGLALVMSGQEQSPEKHVGLVTDWSSRHIAFSPPSSPLVATQVGQDPRYWQQWARRNMHPVIPESKIDPSAMEGMEGREAESAETESAASGIGPWGFKHQNAGLKKDWSEQMGATASMGDLNYPAKYSFSTSTALCSDYAVYNTGSAPTTAPTAATGTFTFETNPTDWTSGAVTVTISQGATTQTYTFETSIGTTANQVLQSTSGTTGTGEDDTAENLQAAIDNDQDDCGNTEGLFSGFDGDCFGTSTVQNALVSATVTGNVLTVTALTGGTGGNTITISTNTDADIFLNGVKQTSAMLTGGAAGNPIATVIAYTNLYTGTPVGSGGAAPCGLATATPTVAFAYSTGGTVTTSPVISLDGTQIAFVQNTTAGAAQLVMIKVSLTSVGTYTTPAALNTASSAANYRSGCTVPCMYAITFALDAGTSQGSDGLAAADGSGGSSVWEDYAFDHAYVGDDNGYVHQFTGVFTGNPAEVVSAVAPIWPVALTPDTSTNNSEPTTSPVYDESRGLLYIGDAGGRMDYVTVSTGAVTSSAQLGSNTHDLYDAPLVDPSSGTNGFLYETVVRTVTTGTGCATGNSCVAQLPGKFASGATPTTVGLGTVATGGKIYTGSFDQIYYAGTNPGHLYMCSGADPKIYELPINPGTGALGTLVTLTTAMTNAAATCSSVTEAYNGTADYIYTSVTIDASVAGNCSGTTRGCVIAYNVTTALAAGATTTLGLFSPGGSSGIIIDNFSGATGASEIYYSPLGGGTGTASCGGSLTAGCAVQAVQGAGL
jgi:hypothetical protein